MTQEDYDKKVSRLIVAQSIASGVGFLGGIALAYNKEKGFWGYVGYSLLGSVVANVVSGVITLPMYLSVAKKLNEKKTATAAADNAQSSYAPGTYGASPNYQATVNGLNPIGAQLINGPEMQLRGY